MHALLLLIAMATSADQATIEFDHDRMAAASAEYRQCLSTSAARYDDGTSDAETIAVAVMADCESSMRAVVEVLGEHESERRRLALLNAFRERFRADAIVHVLANRLPAE